MSEKATFVFDVTFQDAMLALMTRDLGFAMKVVRYIPTERLWSDAHKYLFEAIRQKVERHSATPSLVEINHALRTVEKHKRRMFKTFCKQIYATEAVDVEFIQEKLTEYARKNAFIDIFQTAQTFWNSRQHDKAFAYTTEGMNELHAISFKEDAGIPVSDFEMVRQRYLFASATHGVRVPTKIPPLDALLDGGLEKGELGILLGLPKSGKSLGLIHMGCAALSTFSGQIAHFVLEGTTEQTVMRYQSRLSNIEYSRLKKDEITKQEQSKLDVISSTYLNRLEVVPFNQHWSYTVQDIESKLRELERQGRKPDLVVVDYGDLLKGQGRYENQRLEQTEVYRDLKRIAMMRNVGIWSGSQARRPSEPDGKEYLLRARDIAENYERVRIADLVATLNQTPKEKTLGILRLHIDIYRSNESDMTIRLLCNFEKMIFFSKFYGYLTDKDIPEWKKKEDSKKRKRS